MKSRVYLRHPEFSDSHSFVEAAKRSRMLHKPWISAPADVSAYRLYLKRIALPTNHAFLVCRSDNHQIAGVFDVSNVIYGDFRSAYLGYYVFAGHEHQGLMKDGLKAVVRHAFVSLTLHRLEANVQPGNTASIALVRSCGFLREGYSPRYLKIGGRWRDHERWAVLAP